MPRPTPQRYRQQAADIAHERLIGGSPALSLTPRKFLPGAIQRRGAAHLQRVPGDGCYLRQGASRAESAFAVRRVRHDPAIAEGLVVSRGSPRHERVEVGLLAIDARRVPSPMRRRDVVIACCPPRRSTSRLAAPLTLRSSVATHSSSTRTIWPVRLCGDEDADAGRRAAFQIVRRFHERLSPHRQPTERRRAHPGASIVASICVSKIRTLVTHPLQRFRPDRCTTVAAAPFRSRRRPSNGNAEDRADGGGRGHGDGAP